VEGENGDEDVGQKRLTIIQHQVVVMVVVL
jgi:hypothetical protein